MAIIFGFTTRDDKTGEMIRQPVKSTAARIAGIAGATIIEETREEVPDSSVDASGRFKFRGHRS